MERFQDRHVLSKLLQESILQLCKVSVGLHSNISIDGIICIATQEEEREIIVKIHEQISRSAEPEPTKPTPKVAQSNFRCNDDSVFGKYQESGKLPVDIQTSRDFLLCGDDNDDIFGDLGIKAIMPLNRSESIEAQTSHSAGTDTVVNLIEEETVGYMKKPVTGSETMVMVKPDPGSVASSCTVASVSPSMNCTVTSVLQTRPSPPQLHHNPTMPLPNLKSIFDESSDDDLKIEKLKAGRTRKHKRYPSESSNRMSPTDFITTETQSHPVEETRIDTTPRHVSCDTDDDEALITASSTASRMDIKPILGRKQTPSQSPMQAVTIQAPTTYTNITPATVESSSNLYTNIAPSEVLVQDSPSTSMQSPVSIKATGMTVAQQLQQLRQQRFLLPESTESLMSNEDIKMDDIPLPRNLRQKTYSCPKCAITFNPFKKFHMHMFRKHSAFPCPCCDKMFTHRYSRNRHIVTHHTGEKTFTCPFCNKKYVRADTLKLHVQKQHPETASHLKIHYSYAHGKQLYEPDSTGDTTKQSHISSDPGPSNKPDESLSQEPDVVYNRNLPSKFETIDSESSNPGDMIEHNEDVILSQAQVISEDTTLTNSSAQVQYLKLESMDRGDMNVSHADIMSMHEFDHDDIMDMIEISDDESEACGKRMDS